MSDAMGVLKTQIGRLDEEERNLRAEMEPLTSQQREHRKALDDLSVTLRPFEERLRTIRDERGRLEEKRGWLDQSDEISSAWHAYLAGERKTILVATPRDVGRREAVPEQVVGEWAIHPTVGADAADDWRWTVTHGPSGLCAYRGPSVFAALGLVAQIREIAVTLDEYGQPSGKPLAEVIRAHSRAMR